jgi:hypothetical protein
MASRKELAHREARKAKGVHEKLVQLRTLQVLCEAKSVE